METCLIDHVDSLNANIERSKAILTVVQNDLLKDCGLATRQMNDECMARLLWQVETNLELLRAEVGNLCRERECVCMAVPS